MTITSRVAKWEKSMEMGISKPIFGVGLGNYYDYIDFSMKQTLTPFENVRKEFELASHYPHNIFFVTFAETGVFGLGSLMLLFLYFVRQDLTSLSKRNGFEKAFIIGFWVLIAHSLFNPVATVKFWMTFWRT